MGILSNINITFIMYKLIIKIARWFKREINENWPHLLHVLLWLIIIVFILIDERIKTFCANPITELKTGEAIFIIIIILLITRK